MLEIRRLHIVSFLGIHKCEPGIYIGFSPALHLQCISDSTLTFWITQKFPVEGSSSALERSAPGGGRGTSRGEGVGGRGGVSKQKTFGKTTMQEANTRGG